MTKRCQARMIRKRGLPVEPQNEKKAKTMRGQRRLFQNRIGYVLINMCTIIRRLLIAKTK